MRILIVGDFYPFGGVAKLLNNGDYSKVFGLIKPYIENVDYSIVNFESPIVCSSYAKPIKKQGPTLKCCEQTMQAVQYVGFKCVTLANNHFFDYGQIGVEDTLSACVKYNIDYVGGGRNIVDAQKPLVKKIDNKSIAIVNICENEFSIASKSKGGSAPLNPIDNFYQIQKAKSFANYVIVIVHGGTEGYQLPTPRMQDTYRFFIDCGADVVINHHQHCYSGYEIYKGHPIIYGLGNFCFPDDVGNADDKWYEGYMVQLTFTDDDILFSVIPYVQCKDSTTISLMMNEDKDKFGKNISHLNEIISDRKRLEKEFHDLTKKIHRDFAFEPIQLHYVRSCQIRNWLPSFVGEKQLLTIMNYINCESHLDILRENLVNKLKV